MSFFVRSTVAFLMLAGFSWNAEAQSQAHQLERARSRIGFTAYTKLFNVDGKFKRFGASASFDCNDMSKSTLFITVKTKSVDTDNKGRDDHLRKEDFFFSEKYPKATFQSTSFQKIDDEHFKVTGNLTIRGVTKEVTVPFTWTQKERIHSAKKGGQKYISRRAKGKFRVIRQDYGINYKAGLLLPSIEKHVDIVFDMSFALPVPSPANK